MFNNIKISHRMIIGATLIVLIIVGVGYFGFNTNRKIETQTYLIEASKNMVITMEEGRNALNQYMATENIDKLGEIKEEMITKNEIVNRWIEILGYGTSYTQSREDYSAEEAQEKHYPDRDKDVFNWRIAEVTQEIENLKKEAEKLYFELIEIHDKKIQLTEDIKREVPREKELRYKIRDTVDEKNDPILIRDLGNILYFSKEALYQYKDQGHISEWLGSINKLKDDSYFLDNKELNKTIDGYYVVAEKMGRLTLLLEKTMQEEVDKKELYNSYIERINNKREEMNLAISSLVQNTKINTTILFFGVIFISVILGILLSFVITKSIVDPIKKLTVSAQKIAEGDLSHRVDIKGGDEISNFAQIFNNMAAKLQKARGEISKKVKEQTKQIEEKQKFLKNQQRALLNILEDVDEERVNVTKEKDKINTILQGIGDGVFVVNDDYEIIVFNKVAEEISGLKAKEVIGRKYDEVLKFILEDSKKSNDYFVKETIKTGKPKNMSNHTALIRKDGRMVPVADSAAPLKGKSGKVIGCVVVFRDVTKEREIDKAKTEFVSLASHQLRTPLSSINWYTEMLLAEDAGKINKNQKDYLQEVYIGSKRMVELVNALLNVSRLELGTFAIDPEPVKVNEVGNSVLKELAPLIKEKQLEIVKKYKKDMPIINADPKLIRIVFQNLLSNAVKYTPARGSVALGLEHKGKNILISVKDTGVGIPKNQQKDIFTKLFRADNVRESDTKGTGLGLYIVRAIVEHSGGKIWFVSKENKGTTFKVEIPIKGMKKKEGTKGLNAEGLS